MLNLKYQNLLFINIKSNTKSKTWIVAILHKFLNGTLKNYVIRTPNEFIVQTSIWENVNYFTQKRDIAPLWLRMFLTASSWRYPTRVKIKVLSVNVIASIFISSVHISLGPSFPR